MVWKVIAIALATLATIALVLSIDQMITASPKASNSSVVESISALVLVAAAYFAKTLVDTNRESETTRRTVELINSSTIVNGIQALSALLAAYFSLPAARARANAMVGMMMHFGWVASHPDELNLNAVSASYQYMSIFYSCGLLDWGLLRPYCITIVTGFYVVEPIVRSNISNGIISEDTLQLARTALSELSPGLLQSMGLAAYTI